MSTVRALGERSARRIADAVGWATARQRVLPTFLVVGGQRCGTTTLFKALTEHPGVLPPTLRKGVHYFDIAYDHDLDWYRRHFPTRVAVARASHRIGGPAAVGESSPYYLWHPAGPARIAAALPDVRVIAVLRDPVERAYSAWSHERARGYETEDFESALALEDQRLEGQEQLLLDPGVRNPRSFAHQHLAYLRRGVYVDQLERMAAAVGRDHVLVLDSVDLWSRPADHWPGVLRFLGLPDAPVTLKQHNARTRAPMDECLRQRLREHFRDSDDRLATWWGRTPSWRR